MICNHLHTRWIFPFPKLKFFLNKNSHSFFFPFKKEKFCVFHKPEERNWFKFKESEGIIRIWSEKRKEGRAAKVKMRFGRFLLFLCGWCWSWVVFFLQLSQLSFSSTFFLSFIHHTPSMEALSQASVRLGRAHQLLPLLQMILGEPLCNLTRFRWPGKHHITNLQIYSFRHKERSLHCKRKKESNFNSRTITECNKTQSNLRYPLQTLRRGWSWVPSAKKGWVTCQRLFSHSQWIPTKGHVFLRFLCWMNEWRNEWIERESHPSLAGDHALARYSRYPQAKTEGTLVLIRNKVVKQVWLKKARSSCYFRQQWLSRWILQAALEEEEKKNKAPLMINQFVHTKKKNGTQRRCPDLPLPPPLKYSSFTSIELK